MTKTTMHEKEAAPKETHTPTVRTAVVGPRRIVWWDAMAGSPRDAWPGEKLPDVRLDSALGQKIMSGTIGAVWLEDLPHVTWCPACGAAFRKGEVCADAPIRKNLLRATRDALFRWNDQTFTVKAGEVLLLGKEVCDFVASGAPPTFVERTTLALFRTHCAGCNGPVEVALPESE